jgi:predicted  nucleic acid-binding Zn-ribbon protein
MSETTTSTNPTLDNVNALREKARIGARMLAINRHLWSRADNVIGTKRVNDEIAKRAKMLAVLEYDLSKLDPNHPDFENIKKEMETQISNYKSDKTLSDLNSAVELEHLNQELTAIDKKIADISSGEIKVCRETIDELVENYINQGLTS